MLAQVLESHIAKVDTGENVRRVKVLLLVEVPIAEIAVGLLLLGEVILTSQVETHSLLEDATFFILHIQDLKARRTLEKDLSFEVIDAPCAGASRDEDLGADGASV